MRARRRRLLCRRRNPKVSQAPPRTRRVEQYRPRNVHSVGRQRTACGCSAAAQTAASYDQRAKREPPTASSRGSTKAGREWTAPAPPGTASGGT
jgi:hypothetical protein